MKKSTLILAAAAQATSLSESDNRENSNGFFPAKYWPGLANIPSIIQDTSIRNDVADLCPVNLPLTCTSSTPIQNPCCVESPGGIMLLTQFWNHFPPVGAKDLFTLHGLWIDKCDETFEQFCDNELNIKRGDIERIVVGKFHDRELFSKMNAWWKNLRGDDEGLWMHEFNKHGTCIRTIRPQCYGPGFKEGQNVYDYFKVSVSLYEKYPTFQFLAEKGIVPSLTETYTHDEIAEALNAKFNGHSVFFSCDRFQALLEIRYFHNMRGPLTRKDFVRISAVTRSRCPKTGIKFIPKDTIKPTPPPSGKKGTIKLLGHPGCLISSGQWYTQGTCATFLVKESQVGGHTLSSSKGVCGVDDAGILDCIKQNDESKFQFQVDETSGVVSYKGKADWCFHEAGKHGDGKFAQIPIKLAENGCASFQITLSK